MDKENWTLKYPKKEGWYWSYGNWVFGGSKEKEAEWKKGLHLVMVEVVKISNGLAFVGKGTFLYPRDWKAYWKKAEVPQTP